MANKSIFKSVSNTKATATKSSRVASVTNDAGGKAYESSHRHALAQIAATNCFNGTFYASADANLERAKQAVLAMKDDPEFIAKVAIYARDKGYMKDMPAFITVMLADIDSKLFRQVFRKVVDNGKMLRNVIQIARSGATGRKYNVSAGAFRRAIQEWFDSKSPFAVFKASIGNDPSMRDILRMAHVKPNDAAKAAMLAYVYGAEYDAETNKLIVRGKNGQIRYTHDFALLPPDVQKFEDFKRAGGGEIPKIDFRFLSSLEIGEAGWKDIARNAPWQMTRMNLNTFARHGVFEDKDLTKLIADRLRDKKLIVEARQFPYQIMSAYLATYGADTSWRDSGIYLYGGAMRKADKVEVPNAISEALQDAMEISIDNVPSFGDGKIFVAVDTSGSMTSAVTGYRNGSTTNVSCVQVAGLFASAIVRKNRDADVYTFADDAVKVSLNPRDTVITNTKKLLGNGGGTNVSSVLAKLNREGANGDAVIYVSDNESWLDRSYDYGCTGLQIEWDKFKARNPKAKLVCIDLLAHATSQVKDHKDVLQVGGFGDVVFKVVSTFLTQGLESDHWVAEIEKVNLSAQTREEALDKVDADE
ncbi:MAG: RNA-binding protein [Candidatus Competibacteraceae bacterium]|nr:RNA-binding protein [Candidatus Competibacteraceae bacterium]